MGRVKQIADGKVLEIARAAFTQSGFGISSRALARATGLSQATLIQRFGSKERLFVAAMLPAPLDTNLLEMCRDDFTALVICAVEQIAARVPIALQVALSEIATQDTIGAIHLALKVPDFASALGAKIDALQVEGKLRNDVTSIALVEAILVAAHGFTLMALTSSDRKLPLDAITRFSTTLGVPRRRMSDEHV